MTARDTMMGMVRDTMMSMFAGAKETSEDKHGITVCFDDDMVGRYSWTGETSRLGPFRLAMKPGTRTEVCVFGGTPLLPAYVQEELNRATPQDLESGARLGLGDLSFFVINVVHTNAVADADPDSGLLGDRWSFEFHEPQGGHVQVVVRCGQPGSRALCGSLTMRKDEAVKFKRAMQATGAKVLEGKS